MDRAKIDMKIPHSKQPNKTHPMIFFMELFFTHITLLSFRVLVDLNE